MFSLFSVAINVRLLEFICLSHGGQFRSRSHPLVECLEFRELVKTIGRQNEKVVEQIKDGVIDKRELENMTRNVEGQLAPKFQIIR